MLTSPSLVIPHPNNEVEHAKNQKPNAQDEQDDLVSNQALDDIGQSEKYHKRREPEDEAAPLHI
ncbi:MAG: hypothetical protein M3256_18630 [Actinomycetota bacterium]|nr:hypothetical protein [Actinomycetota bacterium]